MKNNKPTSFKKEASFNDRENQDTFEEVPNYDRRILFALRKIMQQMDIHSRRLIKFYDITVTQAICLYELYEKGAQTISLLSKSIHLSNSTLVGVIDRLEKKKLVKRIRSLEDRREIFIDITDQGREFVSTAPYLLHNRLHEKLEKLSNEEQSAITYSLNLLLKMLNES